MTPTSSYSDDAPLSHRQIDKVPTGVIGLDDVLQGGIPRGGLTLLCGGPGACKTILGLECLVRSAQAGCPGVMLTFEEQEASLRRYGHVLGWDLPQLEGQGKLRLISARIQPHAVLAGDFDLGAIMGILKQQIEEIQARIVLIDAPDNLLHLLDNINKERTEIGKLSDWLREAGTTTLMTTKSRDGGDGGFFSLQYDFTEFLADCVIHLDQRVMNQLITRRMRVIKYRGSSCGRNEYPFAVTDQGIWVIPVTRTNLEHQALGETMPTGIEGLDPILGGGYRRRSCTLITGSSGTGKTTFACSFSVAAVDRGERLLYLSFEESWDAMVSCMVSPGIDLMAAQATGRLKFVSAMPESQGVEEHLIQAFRTIDEFQPDHFVVDAISACQRMGSSLSAFDYLLRLIDYCKQHGVTTLLTNLTAGDKVHEITGVDLSSVIDTVVVLRNFEYRGAYTRRLGILKSRGRKHSNRIHTFHITDDGIRIGEEGGNDEP